MGCGPSQNAKLVLPKDSENTSNDNGVNVLGVKKVYPPGTAFEIPLDESVISGNSSTGRRLSSSLSSNNTAKLNDEIDDSSLIRKHPPRRLKRLEDRPTTPQTIENLEEKLANAELRRQKILLQRASTFTIRRDGKKYELNNESKADNEQADNDDRKASLPELNPINNGENNNLINNKDDENNNEKIIDIKQ